jgi:hypothetical protein
VAGLTGELPQGITIRTEGDRVQIEIADGLWEGDVGQAERVLTGLHYALERARPGTNIASMFLNGTLWGGKFIESDSEAAIVRMQSLIAGLRDVLDSLE